MRWKLGKLDRIKFYGGFFSSGNFLIKISSFKKGAYKRAIILFERNNDDTDPLDVNNFSWKIRVSRKCLFWEKEMIHGDDLCTFFSFIPSYNVSEADFRPSGTDNLGKECRNCLSPHLFFLQMFPVIFPFAFSLRIPRILYSRKDSQRSSPCIIPWIHFTDREIG